MIRLITFIQDCKIHLGAAASFLMLLVVKIKIQPPPEMASSLVVDFLASKNFEDITSNILSSIVAAYIFYVFIEFIPARKRAREIKLVLENLLASIVLSYENKLGSYSSAALYDHSLECLEKAYLDRVISIAQDEADYSSLYSTALHADNILNALEQGTVMAASISPRCSMSWIKITAKARDLAGMVKERPRHDFLTPEDMLYDDHARYKSAIGYAKLYEESVNHIERMRGRYWPLVDEIRYWKGNYSPSK